MELGLAQLQGCGSGSNWCSVLAMGQQKEIHSGAKRLVTDHRVSDWSQTTKWGPAGLTVKCAPAPAVLPQMGALSLPDPGAARRRSPA